MIKFALAPAMNHELRTLTPLPATHRRMMPWSHNLPPTEKDPHADNFNVLIESTSIQRRNPSSRLPRNRTRVWLETFDTAEDVAIAYDTASYILRSECAQLNFPDLKHVIRANSLNGTIASLIEAKLQAISQRGVSSASSNSHRKQGDSLARSNNKHVDEIENGNETMKELKVF
ncbi:hypothetical protein KIW84_062706 [Lathyrus oleraceus]|uniref:AP2/ERF domain-containing protein n=1 Tax=Pisum sativum TaxID=3888 RepID=A0A9D4W7R8_PEA|nr:hypothetical protein KIW84_062706 [Pisum sativum]